MNKNLRFYQIWASLLLIVVFSAPVFGRETPGERHARYSGIYQQLLQAEDHYQVSRILESLYHLSYRDQKGFMDWLSLEQLDALSDDALAAFFFKDKGKHFSFNPTEGRFDVEPQLAGHRKERWKRLLFESHIEEASYAARSVTPGSGQLLAGYGPERDELAEKVASFVAGHPLSYTALTASVGGAYLLSELLGGPAGLKIGLASATGLAMATGWYSAILSLPEWLNAKRVAKGKRDLAALERYALKNGIEIEPDLRRKIRAARLGIPENIRNILLLHLLPDNFDEIYGTGDDSNHLEQWAEERGTELSIRLRECQRIPVYELDSATGITSLKLPRPLLELIREESLLTQERFESLIEENLPEGGFWLRIPEIDPERTFYFHPSLVNQPFSTVYGAIEVWHKPYSVKESRRLAVFPRTPLDIPIDRSLIKETLATDQNGISHSCQKLIERFRK